MRRRVLRHTGAFTALALAGLLSGCFTFHHTVGTGPSSGKVRSAKQWHAVWGLLPVDETESATLAEGAKSYRITTQFTVMDVIVSSITSFIGLYRQTIIVEQ